MVDILFYTKTEEFSNKIDDRGMCDGINMWNNSSESNVSKACAWCMCFMNALAIVCC